MSNKHYIEDERAERRSRKNKVSTWVAIGAVVLIILLIFWIVVFGGFFGDTDVAAFIPPTI